MAVVIRRIASGDGWSVDVTFDDLSLAITTLTLTNDGAAGILTATVFALDGTQLFQGTRAFGTGTFASDISGLNLKMVQQVIPPNPKSPGGGTELVLPVNISCSWSST